MAWKNVSKVAGTVAILASLAGGGQALASCDDGERVIRFSHVVSDKGHPKGRTAAELATRIDDAFDGRFCMQVFPNATLMNDDDAMLEALGSGELEMAAPSMAKLGGVSPRFQVFDLPFMFADLEAVTAFQYSPAGVQLLDETKPAGITALTYWHNGLTQLSATRPILTPADPAGLKFRISGSKVSAAYFAALGAETEKLAFSAVYDALASGEIEGQENTWSNINTKRFYEHQDSVTETNHRALIYAVIVSTRFLESLTDADRETFERIVAEVTHEYNRFAFEIGQLNKIKLMEKGVRVHHLDEEERRAWIDAMKPVWEEFSAAIGPELIAAAAGRGGSGF
ncbi:MAG: DctP family TRAP transporter solute-binding subunit [Pseudomonadota bacterium]